MKRAVLCICVAMLSVVAAAAQEGDFRTTTVDKRLMDYPDRYDMGTPLDAFISYMYLVANGKAGMRSASTSAMARGGTPADAPDQQVPEEQREALLNIRIDEVILYRDSLAGVINRYRERYLLRLLSYEGGKWLNLGENGFDEPESARRAFIGMAPELISYVRKMNEHDEVSADTLAFVNHVRNSGQDPKSFMLEKLTGYKLVVYGETHKRKASWDLLKSVIGDPSFPQRTGIVFLEMSSDSQEKMDGFFAGETMDREILLDILRSVQTEGWDDRGMYEFVTDLWSLNRRLPENERIKVVLADIPRPYASLKTAREFNEHFGRTPDRNRQMADIVEAGMRSRTEDGRSGLFIVGMGHAFKARMALGGNSSAAEGQKPEFPAGAQLKERFSDEDVYITYIHGPVMNNTGYVEGLTRNGVFDYAFAQNGNKPVAFDLAGTPFGRERFDAILELTFSEGDGAGSYEDNFDGYIFLMPLKEEGPPCLLPELLSEEFVLELRRRAGLMYNGWQGYGVSVKDITMDDVRKYYEENAQRRYWNNLPE